MTGQIGTPGTFCSSLARRPKTGRPKPGRPTRGTRSRRSFRAGGPARSERGWGNSCDPVEAAGELLTSTTALDGCPRHALATNLAGRPSDGIVTARGNSECGARCGPVEYPRKNSLIFQHVGVNHGGGGVRRAVLNEHEGATAKPAKTLGFFLFSVHIDALAGPMKRP